MVFIDVHSHIDLCRGKIEDIIKRARAAGVGIIVNNGVNPAANRKNIELSKKFKEIKAALGCYPTDSIKLSDKEINEEIKLIMKNKDKISAIGEVGLDLKEYSSNLERQKEVFGKFIDLSMKLNIPLIVHSRKAEKECIEFLEKSGAKKVIMHCFSGNFTLVRRIIENKWALSIPANITFSEHFQKVAKETPISQLLCETDSPYLHPIKGRYDNEPSNVVESYKKIAEIKGKRLEEVEKEIKNNYDRLFKSV